MSMYTVRPGDLYTSTSLDGEKRRIIMVMSVDYGERAYDARRVRVVGKQLYPLDARSTAKISWALLEFENSDSWQLVSRGPVVPIGPS